MKPGLYVRLVVWGLAALAMLALGFYVEVAKQRAHTAQVAEQLQAERASAAEAAAQQSESAREREHLAGQANARLTDELRKSRAAAAAAVADVAERLRQRAEAERAAGGAAGGQAAGAGPGVDGSALACLPDAARSDLVRLAAGAQLDADHLAACQQYVRTVVPLCSAEGPAGD